jgi:tetratricopeptide (TPR) repeat protein
MIEALVGVYAQLGADMDSDPRAGAVLLGHAARLLDQELSRPEAAYDVLVRATTLAPFDDAAHEALDALAVKLKRTKALDAHLGKLVEDALDGKTAGALIRRRAALLTREGKHADAAEAWTRLKNLQPNDEAVRAELRAALRRAGKHQDLLLALGQDLNKAKDPAAKLAIAREVAETWDRDLKNKWEAIEAWTKVLSLDPEDAAAKDAIARLKGGGRPLASDDDEAGETVPGTRKRDQATTELKLDGQGEPGSSESEAELSSLDASDVDEVTTGSLLLPEARGEAEADSLESAVQAEPAEATPMPPPLAPLAPPAPKTSAAPITGFDTDEETLLGASDALAQAEELAPLAAPSPSETAILSDADDEDTRLGRPIRPESEELGQAPTQLRELDAPLGVPLRAREAPLDGGDVLGDEVEELEPEADEEGIEELDGAVEEADVLGDGDDAVEEMEAGGLDALDAMLDRRASSRPPPPPSGPPRPSAAPPPPPPGARMSRPPPPPPPAPPKKK